MSHKHIQHVKQIPDELAGLRLDQALSQIFPEFSRSRLKEWLLTGKLYIEGKDMRPRDKVNGQEKIFLNVELEEHHDWQAEAISLNIVYEDDAIIIINKPPGLVVHPAAGHYEGTLVNALLYHCQELAHLPRAGLIHRLDKDTSGLLLIAKTLSVHTYLTKQLQKRRIHREYRAIVTGVMTGGGTVDAPIGRHSHQRKRMAIQDDGKEAITHYRVIERLMHHTYLRVILETGRTHQIRVHMAHIHYPIVGDPVYGGRLKLPPKISENFKTALRNFQRQALHAYKLEFIHPISKETCTFEAELPEDMQNFLSILRNG